MVTDTLHAALSHATATVATVVMAAATPTAMVVMVAATAATVAVVTGAKKPLFLTFLLEKDPIKILYTKKLLYFFY